MWALWQKGIASWSFSLSLLSYWTLSRELYITNEKWEERRVMLHNLWNLNFHTLKFSTLRLKKSFLKTKLRIAQKACKHSSKKEI